MGTFGLYKIILMSLFCWGVNATSYTYDEALAQYDALNLEIPSPEADGRLQTLNKKGAVTAKFDYATKEFLKYAKGKKVLEVGGAYGSVMLAALRQNKSTQYVLSDLDKRHLFIAAKRLSKLINENIDKKVSEDSTHQVNFICADITKAQDISKMGTFDAIFVGRVLHYLNPEQLKMTVQHLFLLLKPKGRVFIVAITPYVKRYESFIPEYEKRIREKVENPGFVNSLCPYINRDVTTAEQISNIADEPFFFLDADVLRKIFEENGFHIIESKMKALSYESSSWKLDGRENVILIAEKK